jgi:hypothetical protein
MSIDAFDDTARWFGDKGRPVASAPQMGLRRLLEAP